MNNHVLNKRRERTGKLKANVILTRDAGNRLPRFFNIDRKYEVNFACLADMPVERGIAKLAGMQLIELPPPSGDLKQDCQVRVERLLEAMPSYDCFYIHIKGPDEPGHDGKFQLKTQMIATIDKFFFEDVLRRINLKDNVICVTSDHATPCKLKAHSDDPVPVLIAGNKIKGDRASKFSEKECKRGSLRTLLHGYQLMPRLMSFVKSHRALRKG